MKKAIGIDFGTTNSVVTFKDIDVKVIRNNQSTENKELTRSCVWLNNEEMVVGDIAYSTGIKVDPCNTILSVKRLMGGSIKDEMVQKMKANVEYYKYGITDFKGGTDESVAVILGGKQYAPEQISAEILKKLKEVAEEFLHDEVSHAVITVPAYFTEKQKNATRLAAQIAGLKVQKLLAEPTAAAIAYGVENLKTGEAKTVMIYDFGGGTFDLSILTIVDGQFIEIGTGGDRWLGGDDLDREIQKILIAKVEKHYKIPILSQTISKLKQKNRYLLEGEFRLQAERIKVQLSSTSSANIYIPNILEDENGDIVDIDINITKTEFENVIKYYIQRTIDLIGELLSKVNYDISMIDWILLVGGSSCIPLVKQMLTNSFGASKIQMIEKPMLAVAIGAGILSHRLGDDYEKPEIKEGGIVNAIDDIAYTSAHSLYIQIRDNDSYKLEKIIDFGESLPLETSYSAKTTINNQKIVRVSIHTDIENNQFNEQTTSYFSIDTDIPIQSEIIFTIYLSTDNILTIKAHPKGFKNLEKEIIIGRGHKDSLAFRTIKEYTDKILTDISYWHIQDKFFELQKEMVKLAEAIGKDNGLDNRWSEIDFKIKNAYDEAANEYEGEKSGNRDENIIYGAVMLMREYHSLIPHDDISRLRELINQYEDATVLEKNEVVSRVDKITDRYTELFALYRLKTSAEKAVNRPKTGDLGNTQALEDANLLRKNHDLILNYFQMNKNDEGYQLLAESVQIAKKY